MRYFHRKHILVIAAFLILGVLFSAAKELHTIWVIRYATLYSLTDNQSLMTKFINSAEAYFQTKVLANQDKGLPFVRLYIPEQAQAKLLEDLPNNLKKWQPAHMIYPDGEIHKIKVRHRGGNPLNWLHTTKSWRIKTKKSSMINRIRKINYVKIQEAGYLSHILSYDLHTRLGLTTQKARLVELFINDTPAGIVVEAEQLDENFLRNNNFMPANLYKGEVHREERTYGIEHDLFNNPALWEKVAVFNQLPEDDNSDLAHFLDLIKKANTDEVAFYQLTQMATFKDWAIFSGFDDLIQSWHSDTIHNMRLISDPWKGTISPVLHDPPLGYRDDTPFIFDKGSTPLLRLYNQSSAFLWAKQQEFERIIREKVLLKSAADMKARLPAIERSVERDAGRPQMLLNDENEPSNIKEIKVIHRKTLAAMDIMHNTLTDILYAKPATTWARPDGARSIVLSVDGFAPTSEIRLEGAGAIQEVYWDRDGDNKISKADMRLPVKNNMIMAKFFSNRDGVGGMKPAAFRLLFSHDINFTGISAANPLNSIRTLLVKNKVTGRTPRRFNVPLFEKNKPPVLTFSDTHIIRDTRVFDQPVSITPGTKFLMSKGASLIFRGQVIIQGTDPEPVSISALNPKQPWGVVAFSGQQAAGSRASHLKLSGGSGTRLGNTHYIAMLSVHDTTDIKFDNLDLSKNYNFDDMMHVIYSTDVAISNSRFHGSNSDSIDVDISEIRFESIHVDQAGNDAIDLMSSTALLVSSELENSGDKGISVGEGSDIIVYNTALRNNAIGIEAKDGSQATVANSEFSGNDIQLNAYTKNWRYGSGGFIEVDKSAITTRSSKVSAAKGSSIIIYDTSVQALSIDGKKRVKLVNSDCLAPPCSGNYADNVAQRLASQNLPLHPEQRGMLH